ncbi:MAG: ribosomal L7Ae/L30e/S12e/Gadd45 family protein [Gemmatimonadaceae bacterium]|nr:ribosomal L7Ae/L30e/S12e/Gadd45 family protein [Gemmatimonadaceae bacterium]MCW5825059.1 ribosomal L7Ae/L30e/S12e/Gadd45 family protein [Gemmatimonadaceae bacterium]
MDEARQKKVLGLLGLGVRGRLALVGVDRVREAVKGGKVRVAVVARDASPNSRQKVDGLLAGRGVPTLEVDSAATLGQVAGRETTAIIGVVDDKLAAGILAAARLADAGREA